MEHSETGQQPLPRPRYIFQVDSDSEGSVIRVLDTHEDRVFREISVQEFLAYARVNSNVKAFLLGHAS